MKHSSSLSPPSFLSLAAFLKVFHQFLKRLMYALADSSKSGTPFIHSLENPSKPVFKLSIYALGLIENLFSVPERAAPYFPDTPSPSLDFYLDMLQEIPCVCYRYAFDSVAGFLRGFGVLLRLCSHAWLKWIRCYLSGHNAL